MPFTDNRLNTDKLIAKRDVFAIGGAFRIMDTTENLLLYSRQKLFKLKEDIRVFDSKEMTNEVLSIKARQIIDFSAAYDVVDSATGEKVGALRRKGWTSLARDKWEVMDSSDNVIAIIEEDSMALALIRRFLLAILPQKYNISSVSGQELGMIKQRFNPFIHNFDVDFSSDPGQMIDRRLAVAGLVLLLAIEGKQR